MIINNELEVIKEVNGVRLYSEPYGADITLNKDEVLKLIGYLEAVVELFGKTE